MEKIHIGIALLLIKEICRSNEKCKNCPMIDMCTKELSKAPMHWNNDNIPNIGVKFSAISRE